MRFNYCPLCGSQTKLIKFGDDFVNICKNCQRQFQEFMYTCVIIVCINDNNKIACIKQSYGKDRYVLVAGFVKPLESLEEAVRREVKEELGLEASNISYLGSYPMDQKENLMVAYKTDVSGFINLSSEVKEVVFVEKEEALDLLRDASIAYKVVKNL